VSLFGASSATKAPDYTHVQLQTSSEGVALPVVYGVNRIGPNVMWIDNFKKHSGGGKKGGGKGGGKSGGQGTTYSAAIMLAMCEGPIAGVNQVFVNNTVSSAAALNFTVFLGTSTQLPFSAAATPGSGYVPMAYRGVAYLADNNHDLGSGAVIPMHGVEIIGFGGFADQNPAYIIYDLCTNARYGLGMPPDQIGDRTLYAQYCAAYGLLFSPALQNQEQAISIFQRWAELSNSWIFWSENKMKFVPLGDQPLGDFVPVVTPIYDLSEDDFSPAQGQPPVIVNRGDPSDSYNWVKLTISDRSNQYSPASIEYKDQTSIDTFGLFQAQDVQADEVCTRDIGAVIVGLIGARAVYIRNIFSFTLSFNFCLLEPGDIVTLNVASLGMVRHPVRIQTMTEDESGALKFTAEECPAGIGSASAVGAQASAFLTLPGINDDPGDVNVPLIIEPPAVVTANVAQIWVGLSGANPVWAGADVWISIDDVTYIQAGTVQQATPQGVLIANLASHSDPDTADTLSIDFTESRQILSSAVTHADADALRSIVVVNRENIGFGAVIPNAHNSFSYDLSYLRRGSYHSPIAAALIGDQAWVILPDNVLKIALPQQYVGQTIYLKFPSFNLLGGGHQDISTVTRYSYVPSGVVYSIDPPTSAALAISTPSGATSISLTLTWGASDGPGLGAYEVQMSDDGGSTWTAADVTLGASALSFTLASATPFAIYAGRVRAISANGLATSSWAASGTVNAGAGPSISGASLLALVNGDTPVGVMIDPSGVPVYVEQ
jgi:hypothetical protein